MVHALIAALTLSIVAAEPQEIRFTSALGIATPSARSGSRTLARIDPIESIMVRGGWRAPAEGSMTGAWTWRAIKADEKGLFTGDEESPLAGGWVCATYDAPSAAIMMLDAQGHGSVFVNGQPRGGDPYSWGFVQVPVALKAGTNELLFSVGRGQLRARLVAPPAPAFVAAGDVLVPSLVAGCDTAGPIGVAVVNANDDVLAGARIRVASDLPERDSWVELHAMPALTVKKVALPARFSAGTAGQPGARRTARVTLVDRAGAELFALPVELTTVAPADRRVVTRTSAIDASAQYYAVVPATASKAGGDPQPGILMSVHGASVEATGQAGAYAPKKEAHVVCPTNRRPFGFDWEDWGRTDFMETLAHARASLANDPRRSWLTGHSMGGHGTWQLGAHFPGEFAAIAPSAGWISFASYVGATAAGTAKPEGAVAMDAAAAMLLRAGRASDTLELKENYLQQGVYVLHGDADDNVPVSEAREMFKQLAAISHPDFEYYERPGAGHWWGNECVDWPPLTQFVFRHALPEPKDRLRVRFRTVAPQVSSRNGWVSVLQQARPYEVSSVDASLDAAKRTVAVTTENVAMLDLSPPIAGSGTIAVTIDGDALAPQQAGEHAYVRLHRAPGIGGKPTWSIDPASESGAEPSPVAAGDKSPERGGPFKNAFGNGFIAILGTQGDNAADALLMAKVRYDADQWWVRGNGRFEIVLDSAFDPKEHDGCNVILYGNHDENSAWTKVIGDAPVVDVRNGAFVGPTARHAGDDIAVMLVLPRADCDRGQVGVVAATGATGMRAVMRTPVFVAGVGIPDLVAFRADMLEKGAAGIIEAGYFGNDWGVDTGSWLRR